MGRAYQSCFDGCYLNVQEEDLQARQLVLWWEELALDDVMHIVARAALLIATAMCRFGGRGLWDYWPSCIRGGQHTEAQFLGIFSLAQ